MEHMTELDLTAVALTSGWDATHGNLPAAPRTGQPAGYTTGFGGIAWDASDWSAHPGAIRIDQDAGARDTLADVLDVEAAAATADECAAWVRAAQAGFTAARRPGQRRPTIYCNMSTLPSVADALLSAGVTGVGLWLARPGLTWAEAAALVSWGTAIGGPWPVVGVQYSWLSDYDQDVFSGAWLKDVSGDPPPPPPPPTTYAYGPPQHLVVRGGHTSVVAVWGSPAGVYPEKPAEYAVYIYRGTTTDRSTAVATYPRTVTGLSFDGGGLARHTQYTMHVVAAGPGYTHTGPDVFAAATFTTS